MPRSPKLSSPVRHRALFLVLIALAVPGGFAQSGKFGPPADRAAGGKADQAEGARILADFRGTGIIGEGDCWLSVELRVMPRQGSERTVTGTLLGMRGASGPLFRLSVAGEHWLIESGPHPTAWTAGATGDVVPAAAGQTVAGTGLTVFDLQMPFLHWTDFTYEGQAKVRGRPTHSFILRPPPGYVPPEPGLTGVRVLLDVQFQAMVQAELLGAKGAAVKSIALLDLKKVGDQYIPKEIDFRNNQTRDKTRFTVTAAALGLGLTAETFAPGNLRAEPPAIPPGKVVKF